MAKDKTGGSKPAPSSPKPSKSSNNSSRGQGTNPINKSGNFSSQTTTGSTGPKGPAKKK